MSRAASRQSTVVSYCGGGRDEGRTPTPKILLDAKDGTLHWPVYQVGGKKGSGMLISTHAILRAPNEEHNRLGTKSYKGRTFICAPIISSKKDIHTLRIFLDERYL